MIGYYFYDDKKEIVEIEYERLPKAKYPEFWFGLFKTSKACRILAPPSMKDQIVSINSFWSSVEGIKDHIKKEMKHELARGNSGPSFSIGKQDDCCHDYHHHHRKGAFELDYLFGQMWSAYENQLVVKYLPQPEPASRVWMQNEQ